MDDRGWIMADALVALALLAIGLGSLAPALAGLGRILDRQEAAVAAAIAEPRQDALARFR